MTGAEEGRPARVRREIRERTAQRRRIAGLLPIAGPGLVATAVAAQLAGGVAPVAFVVATASVIDRVPSAVAAGDWHRLTGGLVAAGGLFLAQQVLLPVHAVLGERIRRRIDDEIRDRMMAASFAGASVAALEDGEVRECVSDGVNMLRVDAWTPGAAAAGLVALLSRYLTTLLAVAVVGYEVGPAAGVALLAGGLTIRFGYRLGLSAFGRHWGAQSGARRKRWYFRDLLLGDAAYESRVFGLLGWLRARFCEAAVASTEPTWRARRRIFYGPYVGYALAALAAAAATLMIAGHTAAGARVVGPLTLVVQAALAALAIGGFIAESDLQTEYGMQAFSALERFERAVAAPPAAAGGLAGDGGATGHADGTEDPAGRPRREIRFESVGFAYDRRAPVFAGLDLTIEAGRSLAVVGFNGAGKTTLIKLLARFHEPQSGRITVDGIDVRSFPAAGWQRRIAPVFQDFVRFELPLRDNVGLGAVEAAGDTTRVLRALRRAGAADVLAALPGGLATPLSRQYTGGTDLSGGEWQRVAIARALLAIDAGATVLVLDEPTASLDARAEAAFFDDFLELTQGLTTIVVSHRFSTVRRADRIVVIDDGRVIESGTHDELLALGGRYQHMFDLQAARLLQPGRMEATDA
ncbi:ABC transporter ATP-binding protein [Dactylosporangium sp. CA-139114]|uniref:ABC transporter ATP-binding protein n=1 Tax=Dactylosporangium sp. CA-139114 TaxID=3239931 RepID=UPI003D96BC1F